MVKVVKNSVVLAYSWVNGDDDDDDDDDGDDGGDVVGVSILLLRILLLYFHLSSLPELSRRFSRVDAERA